MKDAKEIIGELLVGIMRVIQYSSNARAFSKNELLLFV